LLLAGFSSRISVCLGGRLGEKELERQRGIVGRLGGEELLFVVLAYFVLS
jgi:hypothetical protein